MATKRNSRRSGKIGPAVLGQPNGVIQPRVRAVGPERSQSGKPILAGDPHLDARLLPGPWCPLGLIAPELRAVIGTKERGTRD